MTRYVGKDGIVTAEGTVVAEISAFELNDERAVARAPSMGSSFVGHGIGAPAYTGTIRCQHDPDDGGQVALRGTGPLSLQLQPQGVGSGLPQWDFAAVYVSSIPTQVGAEEFATVEFQFVADSALVVSAQP